MEDEVDFQPSEAFLRLKWIPYGPPASFTVIDDMRDPVESITRPYHDFDGSGAVHPVAAESLATPPLPVLRTRVYYYKTAAENWDSQHWGHADQDTGAIYVPRPNEDDPHATKLVACCGTRIPTCDPDFALVVTPSDGRSFVTVGDYVRVVGSFLEDHMDELLRLYSGGVDRAIDVTHPLMLNTLVSLYEIEFVWGSRAIKSELKDIARVLRDREAVLIPP